MSRTGVRIALGGGAFVLVVGSWVWRYSGWTGWPWEPFRVVLLAIAIASLIKGSRKQALAAVAAWAAVASPLTVAAAHGHFDNSPPGFVVGSGVPTGAYRVNLAGPVPFASTWLSAPQKLAVDGEMGDPTKDLVVWSVAWLPWPHVDRVHVRTFGGSADSGMWTDPSEVQIRRNGQQLLLTGRQYVVGSGGQPSFATEVTPLEPSPSTSVITWMGWAVLLIALIARRERRKARMG